MSFHDKAIRLVEGGFVEIDGHVVAARKATSMEFSCDLCEMDSICHGEIPELCVECDSITQGDYYFVLAENLK